MSVFGVNAALMDALPDLKLIACNGAGLERIDLVEAQRRGIAVCHTPDELAEDVADGADRADLRHHAPDRRGGSLRARGALDQGTHGAVAAPRGQDRRHHGPGQIGRVVAQRAQAIGMHGALFRAKGEAPLYPIPSSRTMRSLPSESDVLILSCPGGEATRHLVGQAVLERLGPDGYLVNVARGSVVDEAALIAALQEKKDRRRCARCVRIRAEHRPKFLTLDNVVLQPHSASITHETRAAMLARLIGDIAAYAEGVRSQRGRERVIVSFSGDRREA
jgi:lactate dehydrogenase-like 2-hydroxyacid dehydrogenase